jgi:hypothetical protein
VLGASAVDANGEDDEASGAFSQSLREAMAALIAPLAKPILPPIPTAKPERETTTAANDEDEPDAETSPGIVAQCGPASIVSRLAPDGETLVYRTTFAPDMADTLIAGGCGQFFQGCNVCTVAFTGCSDAERDACKTPECLEKACERRVRCTNKVCEVRGRAPTCDSRMVRTSCLREMF